MKKFYSLLSFGSIILRYSEATVYEKNRKESEYSTDCT